MHGDQEKQKGGRSRKGAGMKPCPGMTQSEPMNENERRRLECIAAARADVPHAIAGDSRTPRFMELIRGIYASERNPQRDGMFVEVIRRTGRMNAGTFYRITDGKGSFWTYPASSTLIIGQLEPDPVARDRETW